MPSPTDIPRLVERHKEKLLLVGYFLIMTVFAKSVATMVGNAWKAAWIPRTIIEAFWVFLGISIHQIGSVAFGFFLGALLLMTLDPKKRWQGILLWIAVFVAVTALQSIGLFNLNFLSNLPWLIAGIGFGLLVNGGRQLTNVRGSGPLEFRRASKSIFGLLFFLVLYGFVESHLAYQRFILIQNQEFQHNLSRFTFTFASQGFVQNAFFSIVFIVALRRFIKYDAEREFFLIGPRASGKSMFLLAAYLDARERIEDRDFANPLRPSPDLLDMIDQLSSVTSGWVMDATDPGEIGELYFKYVHGTIFPKNIEVATLDYAGEHLERLPDALAFPEEFEDEPVITHLVRYIDSADTLILIIDSDRFVNNRDLEISPYPSILSETNEKDVLLVATKADLLADQFYDEMGLRAERNYEEFTEYVNDEMREDELIYTVIQEAGGGRIYPVYYQTRETETGERVPRRDDRNNLMTVGYDKVLDRLGRL